MTETYQDTITLRISKNVIGLFENTKLTTKDIKKLVLEIVDAESKVYPEN